MTEVPAALHAAYAGARYAVQLDDGWREFRVGKADATLDNALRRFGCRQHWHYLTPFNPGSIAACPLGDGAVLDHCAARIRARDWPHLPAYSENDDGDWHEPGFVVLDVAPLEVEACARDLGQLAIVHAALGAAPTLVWL